MIAAPRSGSGKTTVTLGLLAALRGRGVRVRAAKTGPDYIDPAFHEVVTGSVSLNLDSWAMSDAVLTALLAEAADGAELLLIESAMGLFDGLMGPEGARGSPADIARRFGIPVLLVLDVSGQGQSAAAVAHGFATLEPGVQVMGVVLNRVASDRHERMARQAIEATGLPVMGVVRRDAELALPERHLGLVQAREQEALPGLLADLAQRIEAGVDLDRVVAGSAPLGIPVGLSECVPVCRRVSGLLWRKIRLFRFYMGIWRKGGAVLVLSWCRFHRWLTRARMNLVMSVGCRVGIRSFMLGG